jgi:uncharacterized membrane protein YeaQ/YmgE (transglycosylase-associated protein family)
MAIRIHLQAADDACQSIVTGQRKQVFSDAATKFREIRYSPVAIAVIGENNMAIESLIVFLIVGAIAGWLAGLIVRGFGFGLLGNIVVGVVGAFIAGWLFPRLGFSLASGIVGEIIHALIGAVILLLILRIVKRA